MRRFADIPGEYGYRADDDGDVWSGWRSRGRGRWEVTAEWRRLTPCRVNSGYMVVGLRSGSKKVHSLILEAFVGPRPPGMECRHLDGNPTNNRLDNLRWGTKQENADDRVRHNVFGRKGTRKTQRRIAARISQHYGIPLSELLTFFGEDPT